MKVIAQADRCFMEGGPPVRRGGEVCFGLTCPFAARGAEALQSGGATLGDGGFDMPDHQTTPAERKLRAPVVRRWRAGGLRMPDHPAAHAEQK